MLTMNTNNEDIGNLPQMVEDRIALINVTNNFKRVKNDLELAHIQIREMENDHLREINEKDKEIEELKHRLEQCEK